MFLPWGGFLAEPTPEEIAEHCDALGRKVVAALDAESPRQVDIRQVATTAERGQPGKQHHALQWRRDHPGVRQDDDGLIGQAPCQVGGKAAGKIVVPRGLTQELRL